MRRDAATLVAGHARPHRGHRPFPRGFAGGDRSGRAGTALGPLGRRVRRHSTRIKDVAASYSAGNVRVIGSVARGAERADSMSTSCSTCPPVWVCSRSAACAATLEDLLHARVDLVPADGLEPEVRANVESDLVT